MVKGRRAMWRAIGSALAVFAASACGFPSPEACALACGDEGACPGGFVCQAESQLCVPRGAVTFCPVTGVSPSEPGTPASIDAGAGGVDPSGAGGVGTAGAGQGGSGGEPGGAGGEAGASSEPEALTISEVAGSLEVTCTGNELEHVLRASGGASPYVWRLMSAPAGVQLSSDSGAEVAIVGVPSEPGTLIVELEDGTGNTAHSAQLDIYETPQISTTSVPAICGGAAYTALLIASGGRSDEYVWSAELVPAAGLPDTLEELGLTIDGPTLSGQLPGDFDAEDARAFQVMLAVHDGRCGSNAVPIAVDVVPGDSEQCPAIHLANPAPGDVLPPPCLGNAYTEVLSAEGGEPPYDWAELSVPPGLSFDASSATIEGIAEGEGVFAVELTDRAGRTIQKVYEVAPRATCWLAYVASEPSPARLELVDALLLERQPDEARRVFPAEPGGERVLDFQLSSDGRFIAYRLGAEPGSLRLELIRLSDGRSMGVDDDGSVDQYRWSADAALLAVAFASGAQTFLGGADVSAVDALQVAPGVALGGVRRLERRFAPSVASALMPFGADRIAFLSPHPATAGRRRLVTASLERAGFAAPTVDESTSYSEAAHLVPGVKGVFVADPATGLQFFHATAVANPVAHPEGAVLSPTGALAALARDGALQIFRSEDGSGAAIAPWLTANGCTTLLAWASQRDRVACADERGGQNQVVVFDLPGTAGGSITELPAVREAYVYPTGEHSGRRRAFSPSGRWLAFVSDANLYVVRIDGGVPRLALTLPSTVLGTRPGALAFSPDEASLLIGGGNALALVELEQGRDLLVPLSASALVNDVCSERFSEGESQWCGTAARAPELSWSSDSERIAFRSSLGTLQLIDVSLARTGRIEPPLSPDLGCSEACSSSESARFQP